MFGLYNEAEKFGVLTLKDPQGEETMSQNEAQFIQQLKVFLDA